MNSVFVIWKDNEDGMWHPVAKLTRLQDGFRFNYTKGAEHKNFIAFPRMDDLSKVYHSPVLFSFFTNRLIPTNRPEFRKMLQWSDIDSSTYDELDLLSVSGGARQTDEFRIIPEPKITLNNEYKVRFFISGIRYLPLESSERIKTLHSGEVLNLVYENDNEHDCNAILVSATENVKIGYCPKYFNCDIRKLLTDKNLKKHSLSVVKVNLDAPAPYKVLCEFSAEWPSGFIPLISDEYEAHTTNHALVEHM